MGGVVLGEISVLGQPVPRGDLGHAGQGDTEEHGALVVETGVGGNDVGDELGTGELDGVEALAHLGDAREVGFEDHAEGRALATDKGVVGADRRHDEVLVSLAFRGAGQRFAHVVLERFAVPVQESEVEVEFTRKVLVENGFGDPGTVGDLVHRCRVVATGDEDGLSGLEELGSPLGAWHALASRGGVARHGLGMPPGSATGGGHPTKVCRSARVIVRIMDIPLVPPGPPLTARERTRFARHLLLPGLGELGQRRLRSARVLLIGAGGLGSPAGLYLAAAGVGTIGIVDDDVVDLTNLQRQVLHGHADVDRAKVDSARDALMAVSEDLDLRCHGERLTDANALAILADYDLVVDGADNFPTRELVSRACVILGLPHVWASVYRFDAQISIWWPPEGPCYHCVFPTSPAADQVPSCSVGGVLGSTVGAVGSVVATEAMKLVTGLGDPLVGRLLVHDGLAQRWDPVPVRRNPHCPVCGEGKAVDGPPSGIPESLVGAAKGNGHEGARAARPSVDVRELAALLASGSPPMLIDVREPGEREIVVIPGARPVPIHLIRSGAAGLPVGVPVYVHCKSGGRSAEAVDLLRAEGVDARDVLGGVLAWVAGVDPDLATY